jgi:predicted  nucleic acid-binding Zn-ribbon protein
VSVELLRQLNEVDFEAVAQIFERAASVEQAIGERLAEVKKLDDKIAQARVELDTVNAVAADTAHRITDVEDAFKRTEKSRREALDAEIEQRRQAADIAFKQEQEALQSSLQSLKDRHTFLQSEAVALVTLRDTLQKEIDRTKQRITAALG